MVQVGIMSQTSNSKMPRLDEIYKNLLTCFDPASKRLVQAGRDLVRAWMGVAEATKSYADALERLGSAGSNCGGETREIGQCLLQISEMLKELNKNEKNTINFYESQILSPTEANLDQDSKVLLEQRKTSEKKLKQMEERVKRDTKKGVPTEESRRMLGDYEADCTKQALTEEKKRYTYMLDRHCALATWQLQFYKTALSLYENNIQKWREACANPDELSAAALAALDAAIQPYATQSSLSLSTVSRLSNPDTISMLPTPAVREQGVGTFHINEGENVRATLDAATVILHHQKPDTPKNGDADRYQHKNYTDPPSTGSSTLSNGSRYATAGDPILNAQKRAASMSNLVKQTNTVIQTEPAAKNGDAEYAVAIKQRPPIQNAAMRSETTQSSPVIITKLKDTSPVISKRRAVAMFTYSNSGNNQLIFQEGDTILVIQDGQQGWQFGENLATGKRGWYPASFTKSIDHSQTDQSQNKPRSNSNSMPRNIAADYTGNTYNGNGIKHSPTTVNGGSSAYDKPSMKSSRPISMMVLPNGSTHRPAPPPPPPIQSQQTEPMVYIEEKHTINYDTVPKHNPFAHVKLRHVVKSDGTPKKYG